MSQKFAGLRLDLAVWLHEERMRPKEERSKHEFKLIRCDNCPHRPQASEKMKIKLNLMHPKGGGLHFCHKHDGCYCAGHLAELCTKE